MASSQSITSITMDKIYIFLVQKLVKFIEDIKNISFYDDHSENKFSKAVKTK